MYFWVIDLLYSDWVREHTDHGELLEKPQYLSRSYHHLMGTPFAGTDGDLELISKQLKTMRHQIRPIIDTYLDAPDPQTAKLDEKLVEILNTYLNQSMGYQSIIDCGNSDFKLSFCPTNSDVAAFMAKVATEFYELLFVHDLTRLRRCEDPTCVYYFYDDSKSKTKRHCCSKCSNRMKIKRYREKK